MLGGFICWSSWWMWCWDVCLEGSKSCLLLGVRVLTRLGIWIRLDYWRSNSAWWRLDCHPCLRCRRSVLLNECLMNTWWALWKCFLIIVGEKMNRWRAKAVPLSCVFLIAFVSSPNCVHCTLGKSPCLYTCILYIPYFIYVKNTPLPHFMYLISSVCALTYIYIYIHTHTHIYLFIYLYICYIYIYKVHLSFQHLKPYFVMFWFDPFVYIFACF